jgi:hypothetical protein
VSIELKREYLQVVRKRYESARKREKSRILSDFCTDTGYSRKYAIRILRGTQDPTSKRKPGRKPKYGAAHVFHLRRLWESSGRMCSKSLAAALPLWLPFYDHPLLSDEVRAKLSKVSPSTIDRLLRQYRCRKGMPATRSGCTLIRSKIPVELIRGEVKAPGFVEADTVAHCGNALLGSFMNSLTVTDLYSGWTEVRAAWGKDADEIIRRLRDIERALPFAIRIFASDNGSEFLNDRVISYFQQRCGNPVRMVRGRPYRKNDQAHVEQKNYTHVRELLGYARIDDPLLLAFMNDLYELFWMPLKNFFVPSQKLVEKNRIGGRLQKRYDRPRTPYQRLMDCDALSEEAKASLRARYEGLNPFELQAGLHRALERFKLELRKRQAGKLLAA